MDKQSAVKSIGVREFREQLSTLLLSDEPICYHQAWSDYGLLHPYPSARERCG